MVPGTPLPYKKEVIKSAEVKKRNHDLQNVLNSSLIFKMPTNINLEYDRTETRMFCNNKTHDLSNRSCGRIVALTYEAASEACVKTKCTCCAMVPAADTCFGHTYALLAFCPHTALAYNVKFEFEIVFQTVVPTGGLPVFFNIWTT